MALDSLISCITLAGGRNDLPCIILHSKSRSVSLSSAHLILSAILPGAKGRVVRHHMPAVDLGKHATFFDYEMSPTSLLIDLSQSEVARGAAIEWLTPIAPSKHIQGCRRSIVIHCADLLSWDHQNALKTIIESSQTNSLFILTTSQRSSLQDAIISRGIVVRCPTLESSNYFSTPAGSALYDSLHAIIGKAFHSESAVGSVKLAREAGHAIARVFDKRDHTNTDLMSTLLQVLISRTCIDDRERETVTQDLSMVDVDLANCHISSKRSSTFSTSIQYLLIRACDRRVKNKCSSSDIPVVRN